MNHQYAPVNVGDKFGLWTVVSDVPKTPHVDREWLCRCECGTERRVSQYNLQGGKSKSCGVGHYTSWNKTYAREDRALVGVWRNMLSRCYKPGNRQYKDYGGRGIEVQATWHDFFAFKLDVGPHPGRGLTFDRVDNEGDYEVGNTRWTTWGVQARNKRVNQFATAFGRTQCVQDWAHELGVTWHHLYRRHKRGMTWQEAVEDIKNNPPEVRGPYRLSKPTKTKEIA